MDAKNKGDDRGDAKLGVFGSDNNRSAVMDEHSGEGKAQGGKKRDVASKMGHEDRMEERGGALDRWWKEEWGEDFRRWLEEEGELSSWEKT